MNTNNNLENEKLPLDEVQQSEEQQSELHERGVEAEIPQPEVPSEEVVETNDSQESTEESPQTIVEDFVAEDISMEFHSDDDRGAANTEDDDEQDQESHNSYSSSTLTPIEEVVERLRDLSNSENPTRADVEDVKRQYYRSLTNEIESQKKQFLSNGGDEVDFVAKESEIYTEGKELIQLIKEKRSLFIAKEDQQKEKNLIRKLEIIEQIKSMSESQGHEDFNKSYQEFKALQQEWSDLKLVPTDKVNEIWKSYQRYVEKFYDLVRINNEFREYDFKKNFEIKTELCEAAERLVEQVDVVSAFYQLQNLHQEWREVGPVSRADREGMWNRFKDASAQINKKYQDHFEALRGRENENLELKTAICEKIESIDYSQLNTVKDWNSKVKEILELQADWRLIGFVPRKLNNKIFKRYREACDIFFKNKNEFYKSHRGSMDENLKKKIALCERAEMLKDSTDWKNTTREVIEIQKEWKSIGVVPHKYVEEIWIRFISACDYYFEQKKLHQSSQSDAEQKNLEEKKSLVMQINQLDVTLETDDALTKLNELMDEWYAVGHVPYKIKDVVHREFYDATERQFDRLNVDKAERKFDSYINTISDIAKSNSSKPQLYREREKLVRQYERVKSDLQTYQNNIGFLSVSSKKGNHLLDDMNHKVESLKSELLLLERKIRAIEDNL